MTSSSYDKLLFSYSLSRTAEKEAPVTKSTADEMSEKAKEQLTKIAKEMGMPVWALYCIGIGTLSVFFCSILCRESFESTRKERGKKWAGIEVT